jgi:hypothetical protein
MSKVTLVYTTASLFQRINALKKRTVYTFEISTRKFETALIADDDFDRNAEVTSSAEELFDIEKCNDLKDDSRSMLDRLTVCLSRTKINVHYRGNLYQRG